MKRGANEKYHLLPVYRLWQNLKLPDFNIIDFQAFVNGKESIAYSMRDDL